MKVLFSTFFIFTLLLASAQAGIQIDSTRVIYPSNKREVNLGMTNNADSPRLIQAWVDGGNPEALTDTATVPFIVTPPIFRLDAGKGQTLRIHFIGGNIPQDRESVYWLNILEVKPKPVSKTDETRDYVQFSVHSRIKIFYRPQGLLGSPAQAISSLRWRKVDGGLECENPSAFNVSINDIQIGKMPEKSVEKHNGMCPAKGKKVFPFKAIEIRDSKKLSLSLIDDYGFLNKHNATYSE